jgi:hypothetical protein
VVTLAKADLPPNAEDELGFEFAGNRLFSDFQDGAVWNYDTPRPRDFDAMLGRNGKALGLEQVLTLPLRKAPVTVTPQKGDTGGAELIQKIFDGMSTPLQTIQAQMCSAIVYRQAFFEKVFEIANRQVTLKKLGFRPAQTCAPRLDKQNASFNGFVQTRMPVDGGGTPGGLIPINGSLTDRIPIPAAKAFVYTHGAHLRPVHGMSDLEVAFWCHQTKQKIRFLWYRWLEVAADGRTAVAHADVSIAKKIVRSLARLKGGGLVAVDAKSQFQPIPVEPSAADQYQNAMKWLDQEASSSVLAGFTDLAGAAASGTGSFALSKDQTDFFLMGRQAVADEQGSQLTTYVARDLVQWNLGVDSVIPKIVVGPVGEADVVAALSLLETLVGSNQLELPTEFVKGIVGDVARNMGMDAAAILAEMDDAATHAQAAVAEAGGSDHAQKFAGVSMGANVAHRAVSSALRSQEPRLPGLGS